MNIKDLKVGDKVFIREDLEDLEIFGTLIYYPNMQTGVVKVTHISRDYFKVQDGIGYLYSAEMVDWEKTIKLRREKMNINDLKVGDKVFIREDLEPGETYGDYMYMGGMCSGAQQIKSISRDCENFKVFSSFDYFYTPEMIDWKKTEKLQNNNCYDFEKITQFVENGKEKTVALTNNGEEFAVTNNDKENDIEKAVMMLMLKARGVTYGDVKKEVEKVKVKWMPTEADRYYYIREIGDISSCFWNELSWDYYRFDFNNCFRTREEAEEKLEKIKEVLKGE